ncbi:MAG: acyl-CoA thioesterase/bile acid-CoA:amino acid N-acyltransferase family protein [Actinomycetota bacterium]
MIIASILVSSACTSSPNHLRIEVDHPDALIDRPIDIRVLGAPPGQRVVVAARATSPDGTTWSSEASFTASATGVVDIARSPSRAGSYTGRDPMGLFWSMRPAGVSSDYVFTYPADGTAVIQLVATAGNDVARTSIERRLWAAGVTATDLRPRRDGFYGRYYAPPASVAGHAGVIVFGGSEGGLSVVAIASLLASHGFPTLALAYFGEPGLPDRPKELPLEYFVGALRWLSRQQDVRGEPLVVWGASLGSEAALLLGADFPHLVGGVVALVTSNVVACAPPRCAGSPFSLDGRAVPTVHGTGPWSHGFPNGVIPVEQIDAPILLDCGGADRIWFSCPMAERIQSRLRRHGSPPATLLRYAKAGHAIGYPVPFQPLDFLATEGASLEADAAARADAWPRILSWLDAVSG